MGRSSHLDSCPNVGLGKLHPHGAWWRHHLRQLLAHGDTAGEHRRHRCHDLAPCGVQSRPFMDLEGKGTMKHV